MDELSSGYRTRKKSATTTRAYPAPHTHGTAALAIATEGTTGCPTINPNWRTNPTMRVRRPSRIQETEPLHRGRALVRMRAIFAASQSKWLRAVDEWIKDLDMRADGRENRRRVARIVGFNADWKTLTTTTLTWAVIAERTGITERSVARHLLALPEAGWIGRVAAGRSAESKRAAGWTGEDAFVNDAPVYVLTVPLPDNVVDINVTPPTESGYKEFPARAHEAGTPTGAASRPSSNKAADGRPWNVPADRSLPAWPSHVTPSSKDEKLLAGREWARRVPALRKLSDEHLRHIAKEFFAAGWTIRDLITALDTLPNGWKQGQFVNDRWVPFSGADGIPAARLGHWVNWRLNAWRDNGTVIESPTQRRARRAERQRIEQAVRLQAEADRRREIHAAMSTEAGQTARRSCLDQMKARRKSRRALDDSKIGKAGRRG